MKLADPEPQISSTSNLNVSDLCKASKWLEELGKYEPVEPVSFSAFFSGQTNPVNVSERISELSLQNG